MSKSNALAMVDLFFSQSTTMHNIIHIQCHVYFHFTYFTFAFRLLLFLVECFLSNLQLDLIQYWLIFSHRNVRVLRLFQAEYQIDTPQHEKAGIIKSTIPDFLNFGGYYHIWRFV